MENKSQFDNNMDDVLKIVNEHADEVKRKEEMEAEIAARKASRSSAKIAKKNQVRKDITMSIASVILSLAILSFKEKLMVIKVGKLFIHLLNQN